MSSNSIDGAPAPRLLHCVPAALAASLLLAVSRCFLVGLRDGYFADGLTELGMRSTARHLLEGVALAFLPAFLFALALGASRPRRALRCLVVILPAAALAYAFVSFHLPSMTWYRPGTEGAKAWAVQAATVLVGLVASGVLLWSPGPALRRAITISAGVGLLLAAGIPLLVPRGGSERTDKPNLIVISLDTLRADHLGCYGYERPTSPELDAFAARSLVFDNAVSPQGWTLAAHASLLTGLYPSAHGIDEDRALSPQTRTLAQSLKAADYTTLAVVDRVEWFQPKYGFDRGFDVYQNLPNEAEAKVDVLLSLLDDVGDSQIFLLAHFYDAHSDWSIQPYDAAPEDWEEFVGDFDGPWEEEDAEVRATMHLHSWNDRGETPPPDELAHLIDQYDAGIKTLDREIGRLLRGFEERGLLENSVIVITSDHGEEFWEHGEPLHGQLFGVTTRVPFVLYAPGLNPGRAEDLVSLVDVTPSYLELAGLTPPETQGSSLAPLVRGEVREPRDAVVLVERDFTLGLRAADWSYVPDQGRTFLFDLASDPSERTNLLDDGEPPLLAEVEALLAEKRAECERFAALFGASDVNVELSESEIEALRALGYIIDDK